MRGSTSQSKNHPNIIGQFSWQHIGGEEVDSHDSKRTRRKVLSNIHRSRKNRDCAHYIFKGGLKSTNRSIGYGFCSIVRLTVSSLIMVAVPEKPHSRISTGHRVDTVRGRAG